MRVEEKKPGHAAPRRRRFRRRRLIVKTLGVLAAIASGSAPFVAATGSAAPPAVAMSAASLGPAKEFSVPIADLRRWSEAVIDEMPEVTITGSSKVHDQQADCEMHFGAKSPRYKGNPPGLVLEPMNCCAMPFPGTAAEPTPEGTPQSDKVWLAFAASLKGRAISAIGVPRIWPEHLVGGNEASNPNHAVELHPLTGIRTAQAEYDFSDMVSAGSYRGGVGTATAEAILKRTRVSVVSSDGRMARISFWSGRIGNFTVLDIAVEPKSITDDGHGSFRGLAEALLDDGTAVPVRITSSKGSRINADIGALRSSSMARISVTSLVLFSLSPESLLDAAQRSNGLDVEAVRPIQLILYGAPE